MNGKQVMSTISNHDFNHLKPTLQIIRAIKLPNQSKKRNDDRKEKVKGSWPWTHTKLSKLFVNSCATDIVLVTLSSTAVERAIAQCTSRWAMARGHRLNTSIVLAAVHGLSGLFRAVSAVEPFALSSPSHPVPVPNRPSRLRGR